MSPLKHSNNIAARMGRWSASHWKTAVFGWLAFVVVAFVAAARIGMKTIDLQDANVGQAHRADNILKESGFGQTDPQTEIVLVQSKTLTVERPGVPRRGRRTSRSRRAVHDDQEPPLAARCRPRRPDLEGRPHGVVVLGHEGHGRPREEEHRRDHRGDRQPSRSGIRASTSARPAASAPARQSNAMFSKQLAQAGTRSVPLTLLILLLVFGSIVAACVPLLLALSVGARDDRPHLVRRASSSPMDQSVTEVVLLIGLAVGVDYSLFYLKREREERAAGRGHRAALEAAAATSGRSVLISGLDGDGRDGRHSSSPATRRSSPSASARSWSSSSR